MVDSNKFTEISLQDGIVSTTVDPLSRIQVQCGDVIGFYVESGLGRRDANERGVVLLSANEYSDEEVYYASRDSFTPGDIHCSGTGTPGALTESVNAAPVLSASVCEFPQLIRK